MIGAAAAAALALVLAPSAGAWRQLSTEPVSNHADPSVLVLPDGRDLVAYVAERSGSVVVGTKTLATGWAIVGDPQLLRQPNGTLLLYVAGPQGIVHFTSSDAGASWTGPSVPIRGSRVGDVQGGAILPDGTAELSQDGTGFVALYRADFVAGNVFAHCCAYSETLAVDSTGHSWIALWSNAAAPNSGYVTGPVGGPYTVVSGGEQTNSQSDRVPLAAAGNRLVTAWVQGYPTPQFLHVTGVAGGKGPTFRLTGADMPHTALAADSARRLWALWTSGGALHAARSRHRGRSFGAVVSAALPRTAYGLEAGALPNGQADAVANLGDSLWTQRLLPGITLRLFAKVVAFPPGHHSVVQFAQALDDGFAIAGAHFNGRKANAQGTIALTAFRRHALVRVTARGYAGASFRMP